MWRTNSYNSYYFPLPVGHWWLLWCGVLWCYRWSSERKCRSQSSCLPNRRIHRPVRLLWCQLRQRWQH